jgi:hypothetical protein
MNARGTFTVSVSVGDPRKLISCAHNSLRTSPRASENVGQGLRYHAARRTACMLLGVIRWWAKRVTSENNPNSAGVVLRIASFKTTALRLHAQVSTCFLKGRLHLPTQDKPPHDLLRSGTKVGAQQSLGSELLPLWIAHHYPAYGHSG